jgi:tetratricopeptide (TPR) repeat protein
MLAAAVVLGIALIIQASQHSWQWSWPSVGSIVGAAVALFVLAFLLAAATTQQRLVIGTFEDYAHKKPIPEVAGIPALVRQEIDRLRVLYGPAPGRRLDVDVTTDKAQHWEGADLDVTGGGLDQAVRAVVPADAKVSLGPFSVPLAPFLSLLARVFEGPRLSGSVHHEARGVVLTAEFRRRAQRPHTWSISTQAANDGDAVALLSRQLAGRVVGLLRYGPNIDPETVEQFHEGLTKYFEASRNPATQQASLRLARNALRKASGRDPLFGWASFNLGLTYQELFLFEFQRDNLFAAEQCFDRACDADPTRWDFQHARCVIARDRNDIESALLHGSEAQRLATRPLQRAKSGFQVGRLLDQAEDFSQSAVLHQRHHAVAWARRAVLASNIADRQDKGDAERTAASTLVGLAGVSALFHIDDFFGHKKQRAGVWFACVRSALRVAADLRPADATVRFQRAAIEHILGSPSKAVAAAEQAVVLQPDLVQPNSIDIYLASWALGVVNYARMGQVDSARRCLATFVQSPCRALDERAGTRPLDQLFEWWDDKLLNPPPEVSAARQYLGRVRERWMTLEIRGLASLWAQTRGDNNDRPPPGWPNLSRWERAIAFVRLAHDDRRPDRLSDREWRSRKLNLVNAAIDLLKDRDANGVTFERDVVYLGLRASNAKMRLETQASESSSLYLARDEALKAIREAPFDATARLHLGRAQRLLGHFELANATFEAAIDCLASGSVRQWPSKVAPISEVPYANVPTRFDLQRAHAAALRGRARSEAGAQKRDRLRQAEGIVREIVAGVADTDESWAAYLELGLNLHEQRRYRDAVQAFGVAYGAGKEPEVCALLAAESALEGHSKSQCEFWLQAIDDAPGLAAAREANDRTKEFGIEADFVLRLADILVWCCYLRGRLVLESSPDRALGFAQYGLVTVPARDDLYGRCEWLGGRAQFLRAQSQRNRQDRITHLRLAVAAHGRQLSKYSDARGYWALSEALTELASQTPGHHRSTALLRNAAEYLRESAELDPDELEAADRQRVERRLHQVSGLPTGMSSA